VALTVHLMSTLRPGRRSHLGGRVLGGLLACILLSTNAGCGSLWVPVTPKALQTKLRQSGDDYVQVLLDKQSLVVSRATACHIGDAYVLTGLSSPQLEALVDEGLLKTAATGCKCDAPATRCTNVDVTDADLKVREVDPGRGTGIVLAVVLVGIPVVVLLGLALLGGLGQH
jgi:hypothetical protein